MKLLQYLHKDRMQMNNHPKLSSLMASPAKLGNRYKKPHDLLYYFFPNWYIIISEVDEDGEAK